MDFRFDSVEKAGDRALIKAPLGGGSSLGVRVTPCLSFLLNPEQKIDLAISPTKSSESKKSTLKTKAKKKRVS